MKTIDLKPNFYMYGNKGACWSDKIHIAESATFTGKTLCGTPMLASNWANIWAMKDVKCPKCLKIYNDVQEETKKV